MFAILINIALVLLCSEIVSSSFIDPQICNQCSEEFRNNSCETFCEEDRLAGCLGQNLTSGCFCKSGTVRDLDTGECITICQCSKN
uniref:Venom protein-9 n=1 Tax=Mesobuthus eupeus TaxID=34648 RepID=E4VP39_MESEU|nr:venom protein-9 [Mesobuthus eupeus]